MRPNGEQRRGGRVAVRIGKARSYSQCLAGRRLAIWTVARYIENCGAVVRRRPPGGPAVGPVSFSGSKKRAAGPRFHGLDVGLFRQRLHQIIRRAVEPEPPPLRDWFDGANIAQHPCPFARFWRGARCPGIGFASGPAVYQLGDGDRCAAWAIHVAPLGGTGATASLSGDDDDRPSVVGSPRAQLDLFAARGNELRPWLAHG